MKDWKKVQGSQETQPAKLDTTSSPDVVYIRKNIERITITDEIEGITSELWQYDELILTRDEYLIQTSEQNSADIDFIAATSGIEL